MTSHPSVPARAGTSGPSPPAGGTTSSSGCLAGRTSRPSASRSASSASSPSWRPRWGWGLSAYPNGLPECAWTRRDEWIFAFFYIRFSQAVVLLVITLLFQWIVRHQCDFTLDHTITPLHHSNNHSGDRAGQSVRHRHQSHRDAGPCGVHRQRYAGKRTGSVWSSRRERGVRVSPRDKCIMKGYFSLCAYRIKYVYIVYGTEPVKLMES